MKLTPANVVKAYKKYGSLKKAWKAKVFTGAPRWETILKVYGQAVDKGIMPVIRQGAKSTAELKNPAATIEKPKGRVKAMATKRAALPKRGSVKRYIFTYAQNNTSVFLPFWENLLVLKDHYDAQLHVSRGLYLTNSMANVLDKSLAFNRFKDKIEKEDFWWDNRFDPYLSDKRLEIAPGLVWCGEMNILPTATNPLSGLETYTGRKSTIIPFVKFAMESIPSSKHEPTKLIYTSAAATMRNYIQRKAGLVAQFHHCYGALLVEVDDEGNWFCRQINADSEGVIYDLDLKVENGELTKGHRVEAITWGDIHESDLDPVVRALAWGGSKSIVDVLKPKYQFFHDVLNFGSRSHHDAKHPFRLYKRYLEGKTDVRAECSRAAEFLRQSYRDFAESVVVNSNHDNHLGRWLEEADGRYDPKNFPFWTRMQTRVLESIQSGAEVPNYFKLMLAELDPTSPVDALEQDESFIICPDAAGGIECGAHGDLGPRGSRGTPRAFAKIGRKANQGHTHSAQIINGLYVAGTFGKLDPDWTTGPSSWSHSFIITYENGKRTIVTIWNGKWKA